MKEDTNFPTSTLLAANNIDGARYIPSQMIPYVKKYFFQSNTPEIDERWYEYNAKKRIERNILDEYNGTDIPTTQIKIGGVEYYYMVQNGIAYMFNNNYRLIYYFQLIKIDNSDVNDCPLITKKRNKIIVEPLSILSDFPTILNEDILNRLKEIDDNQEIIIKDSQKGEQKISKVNCRWDEE